MSLTAALDVLIVYNGNLARSPSPSNPAPFEAGSTCNAAYGYFLDVCARLNLTAGLSSSHDIGGAGLCRSYWSHQDKHWQPNHIACRSNQIFDKFSPKNDQDSALRHLLFSRSVVKSFNSYSLSQLFSDKQKTYESFGAYSIPTRTIERPTLRSVKLAVAALRSLIRQQANPQDFTAEIILKDRSGAGGLNIYKFARDDYQSVLATISAHPTLSFIIQPLIRFDRGFRYQDQFFSTDIRLIYHRGKIISSYIRMAKSGDFRCNQHQGGSLIYLPQSAIPRVVIRQSRAIAGILNKKSSLFTLDFLLSNSGHAYFLEGNTGPGLSWDAQDPIDQKEAKKLIRRIVQELYHRVHPPALKPESPHLSRTKARVFLDRVLPKNSSQIN